MITYKSKNYDPKKHYKRYVRCDTGGNFFFCEVENGYDVASNKLVYDVCLDYANIRGSY